MHQALRIGVARRAVLAKYGPRRCLLHNLTAVHNNHIVRHFVYNAQIVGYEYYGGAVFALKLVHQVQYLCLNGNVQSGGRFVRYKYLGLAGKRHCYHDTLPHTAGKLMGILEQYRFGVRYLHGIEHLHRLLLRFLLAHLLVNYEGFAELTLDVEHRVQACHGLLEYNGYLIAAYGVHLLL